MFLTRRSITSAIEVVKGFFFNFRSALSFLIGPVSAGRQSLYFHGTISIEYDAGLNRNRPGLNISLDACRRIKLDSRSRFDLTVNLSSYDSDVNPYIPLNFGFLPEDHRTVGTGNCPVDTSFQPDRIFELNRSLNSGARSKQHG